jgi:hypothetical protein
LLNVPANPVKLRLLTLPELSVSAYVPAVKLKLIELASVGLPGVTVVAVAVALVTLTTGVPVTVRPVVVPVSNTVIVLVTLIDPEPKARVLVLLLLLVKVVVVRLNPLRLRVPDVRKEELELVAASRRRSVPVKAATEMGKVRVLPAVVRSIIPRPANPCVEVPDTVTPDPRV